jgi:hypothetical protein
MKHFIKELLFISILLVFSDSYATPTTCNPGNLLSNVDISDEFGPVRDQDGIGWCYAYAGADLLNHYLYRTNGRDPSLLEEGNRVSANSLASNYERRRNRGEVRRLRRQQRGKSLDELLELHRAGDSVTGGDDGLIVTDGGWTGQSIAAGLRPRGRVCLERDVRDSDFFLVNSECHNLNCELEESLIEILRWYESGDLNQCRALNSAREMFPQMSLDAITDILSETSRENALYELFRRSCSNDKRLRFERNPRYSAVFNPLVKSRARAGNPLRDNDRIMNKINDGLSRGIPISISYFTQPLEGVELDGDSGTHASIITGREWDPVNCRYNYKIRNSWGTGCSSYGSVTTDETNREQYSQCSMRFMDPELYRLLRYDEIVQEPFLINSVTTNCPSIPDGPLPTAIRDAYLEESRKIRTTLHLSDLERSTSDAPLSAASTAEDLNSREIYSGTVESWLETQSSAGNGCYQEVQTRVSDLRRDIAATTVYPTAAEARAYRERECGNILTQVTVTPNYPGVSCQGGVVTVPEDYIRGYVFEAGTLE